MNWWTGNKFMCAKGSLMCVEGEGEPSGPIPQKSYCSKNCRKILFMMKKVSEHISICSLINMGLLNCRLVPMLTRSTAKSTYNGHNNLEDNLVWWTTCSFHVIYLEKRWHQDTQFKDNKPAEAAWCPEQCPVATFSPGIDVTRTTYLNSVPDQAHPFNCSGITSMVIQPATLQNLLNILRSNLQNPRICC